MKPASVSVVVLHGDRNQSKLRTRGVHHLVDQNTGMPVQTSSDFLKFLVLGIETMVYKQAAHGLYYTAADEVIQDILGHVDRAD